MIKPHDNEWMIECPKCGRSKSVRELGGLRIGAASIGKRTLGHCNGCHKMRFLRVVRKNTTQSN